MVSVCRYALFGMLELQARYLGYLIFDDMPMDTVTCGASSVAPAKSGDLADVSSYGSTGNLQHSPCWR
jgi:hypothetical protein